MRKSIFTKEQKRAIDRICREYDFEDVRELRFFMREKYGDEFEEINFSSDREKDCYEELAESVWFI